MNGDRAIGLERRDGHGVGRDLRGMTAEELTALGHVRMSAQQALRLRCIDCSGASAAEVRLCIHVQCPAWPLRMGRSPWRAPPSEAQLAQVRTLAARRAVGAANQPSRRGSDATAGVAATPVPADGDVGQTHGGAGRGAEDRP
ncbi:hypothetical protein [Reyranella sp.]|uniref:hypothetical protein n=1 Tax=Reyranella sp. TaxID=1929291 RepID=UPI003C7BE9DE